MVSTHWLFAPYKKGNLPLSSEASFPNDYEVRRRLMDYACV